MNNAPRVDTKEVIALVSTKDSIRPELRHEKLEEKKMGLGFKGGD